MTQEDTPTGAIAFTIGDLETPANSLTLTAVSSNQAIVANSGITLGGSGTNRSITLSPVANAFGTTTISISVTDANNSTTIETFDLVVSPINDPPTITDIPNQLTNEDQATGAIPFTIGDLETAPGSLTLNVSSSNVSIVPVANIVLEVAERIEPSR